MTRKHFIALADHIKLHNATSDTPFTPAQLHVLGDFCRNQNEKFDRFLWIDYIKGERTARGKLSKKV